MTATSTSLPLLPTSLVGSYAQPDWLIDRARLAERFPPRVRAKELWQVKPEYLEQAQDDATVLAIRAQEEAGLDIITDGEMRRESYSNHFATALDGVDIDNPGTALDRSGHPNPVPRIAGPIVRPQPVGVRDVEFLKANTGRTVKMTVPGPFTMSQQAQNDHYPDLASAALAYAAAVNAEIKDLHAAGADLVQIDEPYMQARPEAAREYGLAALNAALDGVTGTTAVHICFGYAAIIHDRPEGYSFLPELAGCSADQISIETAQSGLDLGVLTDLSEQDHHPGRHRPVRPRGRVRRAGRRPGAPSLPLHLAGPDHHRHRLRDEVPPSRECRGKDAGHGRCCVDPARRALTPQHRIATARCQRHPAARRWMRARTAGSVAPKSGSVSCDTRNARTTRPDRQCAVASGAPESRRPMPMPVRVATSSTASWDASFPMFAGRAGVA